MNSMQHLAQLFEQYAPSGFTYLERADRIDAAWAAQLSDAPLGSQKANHLVVVRADTGKTECKLETDCDSLADKFFDDLGDYVWGEDYEEGH